MYMYMMYVVLCMCACVHVCMCMCMYMCMCMCMRMRMRVCVCVCMWRHTQRAKQRVDQHFRRSFAKIIPLRRTIARRMPRFRLKHRNVFDEGLKFQRIPNGVRWSQESLFSSLQSKVREGGFVIIQPWTIIDTRLEDDDGVWTRTNGRATRLD